VGAGEATRLKSGGGNFQVFGGVGKNEKNSKQARSRGLDGGGKVRRGASGKEEISPLVVGWGCTNLARNSTRSHLDILVVGRSSPFGEGSRLLTSCSTKTKRYYDLRER